MPRKNRQKHRHRTMKGGSWGVETSPTSDSWYNSLTQGATDLWNKTKKTVSDATSSITGSPTSSSYMSSPTTYSSQPVQPPVQGGKTKRRYMKGGFKDNIPTTGLAAHAAPFSGPTAQPHTWVGGRTRKNRGKKHRCNKSCRHRR